VPPSKSDCSGGDKTARSKNAFLERANSANASRQKCRFGDRRSAWCFEGRLISAGLEDQPFRAWHSAKRSEGTAWKILAHYLAHTD